MPPRRETRAYRLVRALVRLLLRAFFRRVEVVGAENVPADRGGLFVSWHPNALVDPALILATAPRPVVFGARHGLFAVPLLGSLIRALGTVPIYRARDPDAGPTTLRRGRNRTSLDRLAERVAGGAWTALFPEGESHDLPHPTELKSGAARLYYRARTATPPGAPRPALVPVGLHYDDKLLFRSRVLVWYHPPLAVPPHLDVDPAENENENEDETDEAGRARARALTEEIARVLPDVVLATEDWTIHRLLHRGRRVLRWERAARTGVPPAPRGVAETTAAFARVRAAYYLGRRSMPGRVRRLRARMRRYDAELRLLGLHDRDLDGRPWLRAAWRPLWLVAQATLLFVFVPPLLVVGYAVNLPAALVVGTLARRTAGKGKDVATLKILYGALLFPLAWLAAAALAVAVDTRLHALYPSLPTDPRRVGLVFFLFAAVGGALSLRYARRARETLRGLRIGLTRVRRREAVERLRAERSALYDELVALGAEIEAATER